MEAQIVCRREDGSVEVVVRVRLSSRELNGLFRAGDILVRLPLDGMLPDDPQSAPIMRSGIYLSQLCELHEGYRRRFADQAGADCFIDRVRRQLDEAASRLGAA